MVKLIDNPNKGEKIFKVFKRRNTISLFVSLFLTVGFLVTYQQFTKRQDIRNFAANNIPRDFSTLKTTSSGLESQWTAEYFTNINLNGTPTLVRNDEAINFEWEYSSPSKVIPDNNFSVRWTKEESFTQGTYEFTTVHDDGIIILIDGKVIFDNWKNQPAAVEKFRVDITSGIHMVTVLYFENSGRAVSHVSWRRL